MLYKEYLPDISLQNDIECYWCIQSVSASNFRTVYPDGCMDIIFNFGDALMRKQQNEIQISNKGAFVVGNMLMPIESRSTGALNLLGVRFKAGGMSSFFRIPLHLFTDLSVSVSDLNDTFDAGLTEKLYDLSSGERIQYLNTYFKRIRITRSEVWQHCLQEIMLTRKSVSIIAKEARISEKHLQRKFQEHVGISPKQLSQVLRFRELKSLLSYNNGESLMTLAWDLGFTDHAHLTKAFKTFAGVTPSEYMIM